MLDERKQEVALELETLNDYELAKQATKVVTSLSAPAVISQNNNKITNTTKNNKESFLLFINTKEEVK